MSHTYRYRPNTNLPTDMTQATFKLEENQIGKTSLLLSTCVPTLLNVSDIDWQTLLERGKYVPPNTTTLPNMLLDWWLSFIQNIKGWFVMTMLTFHASIYWVTYIAIVFGIFCSIFGLKSGKKIVRMSLLIYLMVCFLGYVLDVPSSSFR